MRVTSRLGFVLTPCNMYAVVSAIINSANPGRMHNPDCVQHTVVVQFMSYCAGYIVIAYTARIELLRKGVRMILYRMYVT